MHRLVGNLNVQIPEQLFLKDPNSTELGRRIVQNSIELVHEIGFDAFTFKKLGLRIGSPESTIYRYFENKHKLLVYLINWYWGWLEYRLVFATVNVEDPKERLEKSIRVVTEQVTEDSDFLHINEILLHQIVLAESTKAYLTKEIDEENKQGYFKAYRRLINRITETVLEIKPTFEHPHTLVSTIIEGAHVQSYFSMHLPALTDCAKNKGHETEFFTQMAASLLYV
jgi:AcrR family transcriptional regulator